MAWPIPQPQHELKPANLNTQTEVASLSTSIKKSRTKADVHTICSKYFIKSLAGGSYYVLAVVRKVREYGGDGFNPSDPLNFIRHPELAWPSGRLDSGSHQLVKGVLN